MFWVTVVGHEAMSVLSLIETHKSISGVREQLAYILRIRSGKFDVLKMLDAFGLISMNKVNTSYTIYASGVNDVPGWGLFVQQLAKAVESGGLQKKEASRIDWRYVFAEVDKATDRDVRVGLGKLETVEIIVRNDKQTPRVLVNGNQRANGSGFTFDEIIRGDFVCLCSHRVGGSTDMKQSAPLPKLTLRPAVIDREVRPSDMWQSKSEEQWNAIELAGWIMHRFEEVYGAEPPFNSVEIQRAGILANGVHQLVRMQRNDDPKQYNAMYKEYVDWLLNHPKFELTLAVLTSNKMMGIFCVDRLKAGKKTANKTVGVPEAFNLPS